jgi:hypothetical protein
MDRHARRGSGDDHGPHSEHAGHAALDKDDTSAKLAEAALRAEVVLITTIALVGGKLHATPGTLATLRRLLARLNAELEDIEWRLQAVAA